MYMDTNVSMQIEYLILKLLYMDATKQGQKCTKKIE
jgi:hypothetical protein